MAPVHSVLVTLASAGAFRRAVHVVDSSHDVDGRSDHVVNKSNSDAYIGNIWVPITLPQKGTFYLNPVTAEEVPNPPPGSWVTKAATVTGYGQEEDHTPRTGEGPHGQLVPDEDRLSCVPHCTWSCSQSVCEQACEPLCHRPDCQTRCPKLGEQQLEGCNVQCSPPKCQMYCPKDICEGRKTLDCQTPKCQTRCDQPECRFLCNDGLKCNTVCPDPVCDWKCKEPKECPKPDCKLMCEKPPSCDVNTKPTLPPTDEKTETVGSRGLAETSTSEWQPGAWGSCNAHCGTGTRTRTLSCSSGYTEDCQDPRPATSEQCQDTTGCTYATTEWSQCTAYCGSGTQTRRADCLGPSCPGPKPATEQTCSHMTAECTDCRVVVYGGSGFSGWSLEFGPGKWGNADMEIKGAKCDDISSLKVIGFHCELTAYQFGDFNEKNHGWTADFPHGNYDTKDMLGRGAKDNDISSMKIVKQETAAAGNVTMPGAAGIGGGAGRAPARPAGWNMTKPGGAAPWDHAGASAPAVLAVLAGLFAAAW